MKSPHGTIKKILARHGVENNQELISDLAKELVAIRENSNRQINYLKEKIKSAIAELEFLLDEDAEEEDL